MFPYYNRTLSFSCVLEMNYVMYFIIFESYKRIPSKMGYSELLPALFDPLFKLHLNFNLIALSVPEHLNDIL